ncbi:MAG: PA0069 family radical SAM protein [Chitinophagales bacterium]
MEYPKNEHYIKGRGAQINPTHRFAEYSYDAEDNQLVEEEEEKKATNYIEVHPKSILNKVINPDIPAEYSMNPYQGCEHGCVYCYARNTHPYWGYSAGLEFEQNILVKKNAPKLLEEKLKSKNWVAKPIMFAGNTDCYQPIERKLEITRQMLEVLWKYRHPVSMITRNKLILRDLDILTKMAKHDLVHVAITITTLDEKLRQKLEPRASSIPNRLQTVEALAKNGIPVFVMMAPIIPSLNDHEILGLTKKVASLGAMGIGHTIVRLNDDVATIFTDWLQKNLPDRADKILNQIADCHGGELGSKKVGERMRGQGKYAEMIHQQFKVARNQFLKEVKMPPYNLDLYEQMKNPQLKLF